ncbi:hypothetical protein Slin15195_G109880 [Septoria linicola]|uniref:Uncharacterized protein n=1 Tax=Septoria linicola TaxID=215465 RepID=A0A9Q9AYU3_9PEZI|nr:hypothetical protein Slin15195_G109880 [Septoria linicola]
MTYSFESEIDHEDDQPSEEETTPNSKPRQEHREVILPDPIPATVVDAIHSATPGRIQTLLLEIVNTIPAAQSLAEQRLLLPLSEPTNGSAPSSIKRKAYETCKNCKVEFSVVENHKGACEKEANDASDMWADHDEDCHGTIEDLADDPDFEDGFVWSCCDQAVRTKGCIVSKHEPKQDDATKKARQILQPVSRNIQTASGFRGPGGRQLL